MGRTCLKSRIVRGKSIRGVFKFLFVGTLSPSLFKALKNAAGSYLLHMGVFHHAFECPGNHALLKSLAPITFKLLLLLRGFCYHPLRNNFDATWMVAQLKCWTPDDFHIYHSRVVLRWLFHQNEFSSFICVSY